MADFYTAWAITSENEGPYSNDSYDMPTCWGITLPFCRYWKLPITTVSQLKAISRAQAGEMLKQTIWSKVLNRYSRNQALLNILLDSGFNKPSWTIQRVGICLKKTAHQIKAAVDRFQIPLSWFAEIKDERRFYNRFWLLWFYECINSGHFKKAAAGLARRVWRYGEYGLIKPYENNGHYFAWKTTSNTIVKNYLEQYLLKHPFDPTKELGTVVPIKKGNRTALALGVAASTIFLYLWFKKRKS